MGGMGYRVGNYHLAVMDYGYDLPSGHVDYLPEDGHKDKSFYDTATAFCILKNVQSKQKKEMNIACSKLYDIIKYDDGMFAIDWRGERTPRDWLFETLKRQGKPIEIAACLSLYVKDRELWKGIPDYYLKSEIGDEDIQVCTKRRVYNIDALSQLDWLGARGFTYGSGMSVLG
ncbi:MAG: hypothetical protein GY928_33725 [Colwellia sp.]|nr:hypothetical protein [Colwellia sp.]